jgi:hypothetical protein
MSHGPGWTAVFILTSFYIAIRPIREMTRFSSTKSNAYFVVYPVIPRFRPIPAVSDA